jgi:hypothetical protein
MLEQIDHMNDAGMTCSELPFTLLNPARRLIEIGRLFSVVIGCGFQSNLIEQGSPLGTQTCIPRVLLDSAR